MPMDVHYGIAHEARESGCPKKALVIRKEKINKRSLPMINTTERTSTRSGSWGTCMHLIQHLFIFYIWHLSSTRTYLDCSKMSNTLYFLIEK